MRNIEPYEHLRLMYKYARELNDLIERRELTSSNNGSPDNGGEHYVVRGCTSPQQRG